MPVQHHHRFHVYLLNYCPWCLLTIRKVPAATPTKPRVRPTPQKTSGPRLGWLNSGSVEECKKEKALLQTQKKVFYNKSSLYLNISPDENNYPSSLLSACPKLSVQQYSCKHLPSLVWRSGWWTGGSCGRYWDNIDWVTAPRTPGGRFWSSWRWYQVGRNDSQSRWGCFQLPTGLLLKCRGCSEGGLSWVKWQLETIICLFWSITSLQRHWLR